MAPKQRTTQPIPGTMASPGTQTQAATPAPVRASKAGGNGSAQDILQGVWNKYVQKTPQRTKLLDTFMGFLVVVGALQFLYVVIVGNFVRIPPPPSPPSPSLIQEWKLNVYACLCI